MSIRQQLLILFLGFSLIPVSIVILITYITFRNELTSSTDTHLTTVLNKQENKFNSILEKYRSRNTILSTSSDFLTALQQYLKTKKPADQAVLMKILEDTKSGTPDILSLTIADLNGNILISTGAGNAISLKNENYFIPGKEGSTIIFSEDKKDQRHNIYMTSRILLRNQQSGIIITVFSSDQLMSLVKDYTGLGKSGETILAQVDQSGKATSLTPLRFDQSAAFKTDVTSLQQVKANNRSALIDYRGHGVFATTKNVLTNWSMTTKIDRDEALAPLYKLRNTVITVVILSSFLVTLAGLYFAKIITAPLILLTEKTKKIIDGDFTQKINSNSSTEIRTLALTFNNMTTRLSDLYQFMGKKVQEKTIELSKKITEVEQQKAKNDAILGSIANAIIVTGQGGEILFINDSATQLLDLNTTTLSGRLLYQVFALYDSEGKPIDPNKRPEYAVLHMGKKIENLFEYRRRNNTKIFIQVTATPVIEHGKIIGSIVSYLDVTKEKDVDRIKTEFISLASHQLRTPLSAIKWFAEMLLSGDGGKLNPEQEEFAKNVYDSTERMIQLVTSLLNISRMESGRIMVDPKPTDLKQLVQRIVNDLKAKIEDRQQNLIISMHDDMPKVNLDPRLISQVYRNLLTNAIKYTPNGGDIQVFVSKTADQIISQITDSGYGIPKPEQGKIFQKFFRGGNIAKIETDGTGLGLYLIKAIIDSSGGKIWFQSEEGRGTTFWFSLPLSGMIAKQGEVTLDT